MKNASGETSEEMFTNEVIQRVPELTGNWKRITLYMKYKKGKEKKRKKLINLKFRA